MRAVPAGTGDMLRLVQLGSVRVCVECGVPLHVRVYYALPN